MPEIGPLYEKLRALEGRWSGEEQVFPNPWGPGGLAHGIWECRLDRAGHYLMQDFAEERTGGYRFDAHGVLTVDPGQNDYVWFWFDSYGFPPLAPSRGSWEGNSLLLEKQTPRGVGRSVFALELELFRYSVSSRPVGATEFMPVMEGTFIRAS